jgi:hypothetical protein
MKPPSPVSLKKPSLRSDEQHRQLLEEYAARIAAAMQELPGVTPEDVRNADARRQDWDRISEALGVPVDTRATAAAIVEAGRKARGESVPLDPVTGKVADVNALGQRLDPRNPTSAKAIQILNAGRRARGESTTE